MNYIPILIYNKKKHQFFQKNVNTTNAFPCSSQYAGLCLHVFTSFFSALPWPFHRGPGHQFPGLLPALMVLSQRSSESPVLTRNPEFLGGYVRGPFLPGPLIPLLVAAGALWVVGDNALELLQR